MKLQITIVNKVYWIDHVTRLGSSVIKKSTNRQKTSLMAFLHNFCLFTNSNILKRSSRRRFECLHDNFLPKIEEISDFELNSVGIKT